MSSTQQGSIIGTVAWSLAVLLAMFIMFSLMIVPAMNHGTHPVMSHGYHPPTAPSALTEFPIHQGKQSPGIDLAVALKGDPDLKGWADAEYAKICAACHGAEGRGDGPVGMALGARNFADQDGWKNGARVDQVFRTLTHGLAPLMPAYDTYTPAQRFALANVVKSFQGFTPGKVPQAELAKLDAEYSLSAGVRESNRIPVSAAVALLCDEQVDNTLELAKLPAQLRRYVTDAGRAGQALAGMPALDLEEAARRLCAGAPDNGFSTQIAGLGIQDWKEFLALLKDAAARS